MKKKATTPQKQGKELLPKPAKKPDQDGSQQSAGARSPTNKNRRKKSSQIKEEDSGAAGRNKQSSQRAEIPKNPVEKDKAGLIKRIRVIPTNRLSKKIKIPGTYLNRANDPTDLEVEMNNDIDRTEPETHINSEASSYCIADSRVPFVLAFAREGLGKLPTEFSKIRNYAPIGVTSKAFEKNMARNRYADVLCGDSTRITLKNRSPDDDYIHANRVTLPGRNSISYICTQGPMTDTCEDFWQMVLQEKACVIVMLCDFMENDADKCANYYPLNAGETGNYGLLKVRNERTCPAGIDTAVLTQLEVEGIEEALSVTHLRWSDWKDHSAPTDASLVVNLVKMAKKSSNGRPIVVHCSAGIGRTGTFVAVDYAREKVKGSDGKTTMVEIVKEVRQQRLLAIQTVPQYLCLHVATMIWTLMDTRNAERFPIHDQFLQDYQKYLKKLQKKLSKIKPPK